MGVRVSVSVSVSVMCVMCVMCVYVRERESGVCIVAVIIVAPPSSFFPILPSSITEEGLLGGQLLSETVVMHIANLDKSGVSERDLSIHRPIQP